MENIKPCIVSFASKGREDYLKGILSLEESLKENWNGDHIFYSFDYYMDQITMPQPEAFICYPHSEIPYQFKYGMIQIAREQGYKKIIWLDSSFVLKKDLMPLFDMTEKGIIAFENLGHPLYKYISDKSVENLGVSEEQLKEIPQIWGGALMFDFDNNETMLIFDEILEQSFKGSFNEGRSIRDGFVTHRHDQAVISVILWKHNIKLLPYGYIVIKEHDKEPYEYGKDIYLVYGK